MQVCAHTCRAGPPFPGLAVPRFPGAHSTPVQVTAYVGVEAGGTRQAWGLAGGKVTLFWLIYKGLVSSSEKWACFASMRLPAPTLHPPRSAEGVYRGLGM